MSLRWCRSRNNIIQKLGNCGPIPRLHVRVVWRKPRNSFMRKENPETRRYSLWPPLLKVSKTSFSGCIGLSSLSFALRTGQSHAVFFFGLLVLETFHSSTISLGGMTLSRKPLNIRMGKVGDIPAILDADSHFWVVKRLRKRPIGHSRTMWGMELNVFSTMSADTCDKPCKWIRGPKKLVVLCPRSGW